jgi:hypothetical protein
MLTNLAIAWKVFKSVSAFLKEVKKNEEQALSDENIVKLRLKLEAFCDRLAKNQDIGWRKYLTVDNPQRWIHAGRVLLKSSKLDAIENGTMLEKLKAQEQFHGI